MTSRWRAEITRIGAGIGSRRHDARDPPFRRDRLVQIRRLKITRFRGIEDATLHPSRRTVLLGPNNAAKSTILEALDLVLNPGLGRSRPAPDELDFFARDPSQGFEIEVVLGNLDGPFAAECHLHLEGWNADEREVVAEPDGEGIEAVVRVRAVCSTDFELAHEFAKPESSGARFRRGLRQQVGWLYDGRSRDPAWQMTFHRGGVLDRLFAEHDLKPALEVVRDALRSGAADFGKDSAVLAGLSGVGGDLQRLRLVEPGVLPAFELGGVSERELLQTLRLALPVLPEVLIPLRRQGRGVQRLILVASLLRLADQVDELAPIAAFEEPEEALEPIRQGQMAAMIGDIADKGGQVFLVTHSVDMARAFAVDDLVLVSDEPRGVPTALRDVLSPRARQGYERRLDGPVVQALFARVPVLVEGPGDRAVFTVFWDALAREATVQPRHLRMLDFINCEGASLQPEMARLLCEAGKDVVAWAELDEPENLERLRRDAHCSAIVLYDDDPECHNLEAALASACSIEALANGMRVIAETRGYDWAQQQQDLLARCHGADADQRQALGDAVDLPEMLRAVPGSLARRMARWALAAKGPTPFEIKGARPARQLAEEIVATDGVPTPFENAMSALDAWVADGAEKPRDITMREQSGATA